MKRQRTVHAHAVGCHTRRGNGLPPAVGEQILVKTRICAVAAPSTALRTVQEKLGVTRAVVYKRGDERGNRT